MAAIMKVVLNIAEKPSVAKEIANHLGGSGVEKRFGPSKYNPVFEFMYSLRNEQVLMRVTSVQGHVMNHAFAHPYSDWNLVPPSSLFEAPISKVILPDKEDLVKNIQECSRNINLLALWLDCDREGENIAFEVVDIVSRVVQLPSSMVLRAQFSALTREDLHRAAQTLSAPKFFLSEAVDARQELDLRLGAAFTRFQKIQFKRQLPQLQSMLLSYGPCQFPTLGFVVDRYLEIESFVPEQFWTVDLRGRKGSQDIEFNWSRKRLFDFEVAAVLYESCLDSSQLRVLSVDRIEKRKIRPVPLATVALQKLASSKLRIDSDQAMTIAEKLYNQGYISYPRTETDFFKSTIDLRKLIEQQNSSPDWGQFAQRLSQGGFMWPRSGSHDDQSHPPIHPVKAASRDVLSGNEWRMYELVTRHFLACCAHDAIGQETTIRSALGNELFSAKGLAVERLNFLEVYPYIKWNEASLPSVAEGEVLDIAECLLNQRSTQPPTLLSEADLISMMDKSGIGTDATIHQHIKTIQVRLYAVKTSTDLFQPTQLGLALLESYRSIGVDLSNPELRAKTERGMNAVARGETSRSEMVQETLVQMREVFDRALERVNIMALKLKERLSGANCFKCGKPGHDPPNCPSQFTCFKCGAPGHTAPNCPSRALQSADNRPRHAADSRAAGGKPKEPCPACNKLRHTKECPRRRQRKRRA
jgi:DNA topoisomerase-3